MEPTSVPLDPAVAEAVVDASAVAHGLSPIELFIHADPIVKGVIILLLLASIACWAIAVDKIVGFRGLRRQAQRFEAALAAGAGGEPGRVGPDPQIGRAYGRERMGRVRLLVCVVESLNKKIRK